VAVEALVPVVGTTEHIIGESFPDRGQSARMRYEKTQWHKTEYRPAA